MATIEKLNFTESTSGLAIPVTATADPGTLIHTVVDVSGSYDEIWLYATNIGSAAISLTIIEDDGTDSYESRIGVTNGDGHYLVLPGRVLRSGITLAAYVPSGK